MNPRASSPWRDLASGLLGAAAYGFALGSAHSELYAARNALKFPLLTALTCAICAPSYWIAARFLGAKLSFLGVQRSAAHLFLGASRLLGGFSPAIFFVAHAARAHDDGQLGSYDEFLALNLICVALAGAASLLQQSRELWRKHAVTRSSTRRRSAVVPQRGARSTRSAELLRDGVAELGAAAVAGVAVQAALIPCLLLGYRERLSEETAPMKPMLCTYESSATPERVWAVASDFANAGAHIQAIQKVEIVTAGPIRAGTVIRETRGAPDKRGTTIDMTISTWNPPRSYSLRGSAAGYEFNSEIRCVPNGSSGTRLEMEVVGRPLNFVAKLFSPLFSIMSKMMVKQCSKDLADIAREAEKRSGG